MVLGYLSTQQQRAPYALPRAGDAERSIRPSAPGASTKVPAQVLQLPRNSTEATAKGTSMVSQHFREMLQAASAPFAEEALDAMDDGEAVSWLERNSDDPWLFHMGGDLDGKPKFLSPREPPAESDPYAWFDDAEVTYVALRVLLATGDLVHCFHALCFHLCQQVIEKGVKSILALQCLESGEEFKPRSYGHDLTKAIDVISTSLLPAVKVARLREVAEAFELGHSVGKYAVNTGGGMAVGIDWMRPVDCYMKIVYDLFQPRLASRRASFINRVVDSNAFGDNSLARCGIRGQDIKRSLLWQNPVFFPNWQDDCRRLENDRTG